METRKKRSGAKEAYNEADKIGQYVVKVRKIEALRSKIKM